MYSGLNSYFYQDNANDSSLIDTSILPLQYTPVYYPPNPWHRQSAIGKDFIVLAEFSEQEGPKPLMSIPKHGGDGFDLNAFALRIMSVDTQSMSSKFSMPEDTQVVLSETRDGIYAYIHHFILHDSQARGFVRPYCMAYVTPDRKKIMTFYESMHGEFNKVSKYLKYGNLRLFHKDMVNYLCDLKYTKERIRMEGENLLDCSVEAVEAVEKEIESIVNTVKPLLTDRHMEKRFRGLDNRRERDGDGMLLDAMGLSSGKLRRKSFVAKRSFSVECGQRARFSDSDHQPRLVNVHRRTFDRSLRDLHVLCDWGAREGISRLRDIHKYFRRDTATILIEQQDSLMIEPRSCMLSIGGCLTISFLPKVETSTTEGAWPDEVKSRFLPSNIKKWESNDTLHSWKSTESFYSLESCSYDKARDNKTYCAYSTVSSPCGEEVFVDALSHLGTPSDEFRDCFGTSDSESSPSHLPNLVKASVQSSADHLDALDDSSPGFGLLKLTCQYVFTPHLYASLLRGRPVCVLGRHEKEVKSAITALSILVPGQSKNIIPLQYKPIKLADLSVVKLVGLVRTDRKSDSLVPETLRLYVTILDLDKRFLKSPAYDGVLLKSLYAKRKNFSTDTVFLAYVHCLLLEMASKSFIYYHEYLLKLESPLGGDDHHLMSDDYHRFRRCEKEAVHFLQKLGLSGADVAIVQYLAEVVKDQQAEEYYNNVVGLVDHPAPTVTLDFHQPLLFKG